MRGYVLGVLVIMVVVLETSASSARRKRSGEKDKGLGKIHLSKGDIDDVMAFCTNNPQICDADKQKAVTKRSEILQWLTDKLGAENAKKILAANLKAKKSVVNAMGLKDLDISDDGVFADDIILTQEQGDDFAATMDELAGWEEEYWEEWLEDDWEEIPEARRKKRSTYFFDKAATQTKFKKWTMPIRYIFSTEYPLSDEHKKLTREAMKHFEDNTCIKFQEITEAPTSGAYLEIDTPKDQEICASTTLGMPHQGEGEPYWCGIRMGKPCWSEFWRIMVHELGHVVGLEHQMCRYDRNDWLKLDFKKIHKDYVDQYTLYPLTSKNQPTVYGVPFDYKSIMMYASDMNGDMVPTKGKTEAEKIAIAKTFEKGGDEVKLSNGQTKRGMTAGDIELLRRIYCMNSCPDKKHECTKLALQDQKCGTSPVKTDCPKSCGLCQAAVTSAPTKAPTPAPPTKAPSPGPPPKGSTGAWITGEWQTGEWQTTKASG